MSGIDSEGRLNSDLWYIRLSQVTEALKQSYSFLGCFLLRFSNKSGCCGFKLLTIISGVVDTFQLLGQGSSAVNSKLLLQDKILLNRDRFAQPSNQFWVLLIALIAIFVMGGSAREDVQSLAVLNPAMIICCGIALITLQKKHLPKKKRTLAVFALAFIVVGFYLIPVPAQLNEYFRGAGDAVDIWAATDVLDAPHFLALAPAAGWQTLFFLFAPLAVLLLAFQLNVDDLRYILPIVILVGAISGTIGVLQLSGSANGSLYLYRITNNGSAVGLFANRNHAAVFLACLFPMLAIFAARSHTTHGGDGSVEHLIAIAVAIILVPLILVTGSRAGMVSAIVGVTGGVILYNSHVTTRGGVTGVKLWRLVVAISILIGLFFATIYFARAEAMERILAEPLNTMDRADFWTASLKLFWQYFPFGFGPGAFIQAFQNEEPLALLSSTYVNRLHNDWLETALTFGILGILFLVCGIAYYVRRSFLLWFRMDGSRSSVAMGRMASVIIAILGIASVSDYPLRTPAMMSFMALVSVWFIKITPASTGGRQRSKELPIQ